MIATIFGTLGFLFISVSVFLSLLDGIFADYSQDRSILWKIGLSFTAVFLIAALFS